MRSIAVVAASLLTLSAIAAQSPITVPHIYANTEGNEFLTLPFGRTDFRVQQIVSARAIAPNQAILFGIGYRADNDNTSGSPAVTLQNVTIKLSQTSVTTQTMTGTFASNITGPETVVYQGPVTLAGHTSAPGLRAPFQMITFQQPFFMATAGGDLLIDVTSVDQNPVDTNWNVDGAMVGGATTPFGTSGLLSAQDSVDVIASANGANGRFSGFVPGGSMRLTVQSWFTVLSGELLVGFNRLANPLDLAMFGAPGNALYISPDIALPFTLTPSFFNNVAHFPMTIPNDPNLVGLAVQSQAYVIDPPANALGVVFTAGQQFTIGESVHPMMQYGANNSASSSGQPAIWGAIPGGAVVQFSAVTM